ncbi:MAG: M24 family metallopeptidase [Candidatus Aminicenantales bacterium]
MINGRANKGISIASIQIEIRNISKKIGTADWFPHDGTALLGPPWDKYAQKPFRRLEEGMVFTIEPRLAVPGRGIITIEDMVVVTGDGVDGLSTPQTELILIR